MPTARSKTRPQRQKPLHPAISQARLDRLLADSAELAEIRRFLRNVRWNWRRRLVREERNERLNRTIDGGYRP
jgi:hypothetical protein